MGAFASPGCAGQMKPPPLQDTPLSAMVRAQSLAALAPAQTQNESAKTSHGVYIDWRSRGSREGSIDRQHAQCSCEGLGGRGMFAEMLSACNCTLQAFRGELPILSRATADIFSRTLPTPCPLGASYCSPPRNCPAERCRTRQCHLAQERYSTVLDIFPSSRWTLGRSTCDLIKMDFLVPQ